jgi:MFS transporter, DHA1 family, inner membrane transport protein
MNTSVSVHFKPSETVAALTAGCIALLVLGLQPALLGSLLDQHRISMEGLGIVAMGEIFSLGIGTILAEKWLPLNHLRTVAVLASLALIAINLLTLTARGDLVCVAWRVVAGLLEACLFWIATMIIVRSPQPDRLAGVFLTVQTCVQAAAALLLAKVSIAALGWGEPFILLAVLCLVPLLVASLLPSKLGMHAEEIQPSVVSWTGFFALLVPFLHMSAMGALWAYMEPVVDAAGINISINALASLVLFMQVVGGAASALVVRWGKVMHGLIVSAVAFTVTGIVMYRLPAHSSWAFAALCVVFGFLWLFQMPFHIRLAFDIDPRGRIGMLVPPAQLVGTGFGPLVTSFSVHGNDVQHVPLLAACFSACVVIAVLLVKLGALSQQRSRGALSGEGDIR